MGESVGMCIWCDREDVTVENEFHAVAVCVANFGID
jgi:hypothetical protein